MSSFLQLALFSGLGVIAIALVAKQAVRQTHAEAIRSRHRENVRWQFRWRWLVGVVVAVILLVVAAVSSQLLVVLIPMVVLGYRGAQRYFQLRRHAKYENDLPHVLDAIARSMRSGASLTMAITEAGADLEGSVAGDMRHISAQVNRGLGLHDALQGWAQLRGTPSVSLITASIGMALRTGAAHAEVIDRVAVTLRQAHKASAAAKTHATQSRASAWALTFLPLLFTGPMLIIDPAVRHFLLGTSIGVVVLALGITLDGLGALWMSRLIQRALA